MSRCNAGGVLVFNNPMPSRHDRLLEVQPHPVAVQVPSSHSRLASVCKFLRQVVGEARPTVTKVCLRRAVLERGGLGVGLVRAGPEARGEEIKADVPLRVLSQGPIGSHNARHVIGCHVIPDSRIGQCVMAW
jgi:hypothetical protein